MAEQKQGWFERLTSGGGRNEEAVQREHIRFGQLATAVKLRRGRPRRQRHDRHLKAGKHPAEKRGSQDNVAAGTGKFGGRGHAIRSRVRS